MACASLDQCSARGTGRPAASASRKLSRGRRRAAAYRRSVPRGAHCSVGIRRTGGSALSRASSSCWPGPKQFGAGAATAGAATAVVITFDAVSYTHLTLPTNREV
eukprot:5105807-Heterocapsa_arctica.AAC.2